MDNCRQFILTVNAGSSSIKIALYEKLEKELLPKLSGKIDHIGTGNATLVLKENNTTRNVDIHASDFNTATASLIQWLESQSWINNVQAAGHRIVHGMNHTKAEIVTDDLLKELKSFIDFDPDHLPSEIAIVKMLGAHYPSLLQVACFDTAFHAGIPAVAKVFSIPKKYYEQGIRRYGFHGISYSYLMAQLESINPSKVSGNVVLAHLGNGASLAAVKNGKCIDTSMGFTPAGGITMSTRSGDLDPGIAWLLMQKNVDAKTFNNIINHQSGLLGISNLSSDMQVLLEHEKNNEDAALAIEIFCYRIKKYIGAYMAALNGLDALVFSGGIGENAAQIRLRICKGLEYAGIEIDEQKNAADNLEISSSESKVKVYVIPTNEELMIAETTAELYKNHITHP